MKNIKPTLLLITKILTTFFAVLLAIIVTASDILLENVVPVSNALNVTTQLVVEDPDADNIDTQYFKSAYTSVAEEKANSEKLCEEVVREGAVLLKNENNTLPIANDSSVTLYGANSVKLGMSGGGSSQSSASAVQFKQAFQERTNVTLNTDLLNWYEANKGTYSWTAATSIGAQYDIREAPWSVLPSSKTNRVDHAIFVLTRIASENTDISYNQGSTSDMTNGNYLELSPQEITVLKALKEEKAKGTFDDIIIIMNTSNQVEATFIDDPEYDIDAVLWCGTLGSNGSYAIAELLVGKQNFSGRLSDTYYLEHKYNPIYANFGAYIYEGKPEETKFYGSNCSLPYVVYQEGIYNGYRYSETRYEDVVLGRANVGDFTYQNVIKYPFGYGKSYSTFEYSDYSYSFDELKDEYTISVKVTNTGTVAGKEVVQVYLQKPYTQYDIDNNIEKASVELVGFAKTNTLDGGASETVTITIPREYFASYDSYGAKTYILDSGDYYLTVAKDSHDAINNILKVKDADNTRLYSFDNTNTLSATNLTSKITLSFGTEIIDKTTYSTSDYAKNNGLKDDTTVITNQFDNTDINLYENRGDNYVTYMTRNNWNDTVFFGLDGDNNTLDNYVKLYWNDDLATDLYETERKTIEADDGEYPTYGSTKTSYSLIDLRANEDGTAIPYNDSRWDDLLDQLTYDEMVDLLSCALRSTGGIASISKPATIDHNGAVGVNQSYGANAGVNRGLAITNNDPGIYQVPPAYPCNGMLASTFNTELAKRYGEAWGEDALWAGYSGLYGPGINLHRGQYAGRVFEYFSEDPILSGLMCAPLCEGIQSKGIYVYLKHAFLNEQETSRTILSTWSNEQACRELYLKSFELAIKEGGASNVMLGLNKLGATFTGLQGFCNTVLRDEFGMTGFVVSDFMTDQQYSRMPAGNVYGMDLPDRDYSNISTVHALIGGQKPYDYYRTGHSKVAWAMRESVHHILYTCVHSAAMNGISGGTKIILLTPSWTYLLSGLQTIVLILLIACGAFLITLYLFPYISDLFKKLFHKKELATEGVGVENDSGIKLEKTPQTVNASMTAGATTKKSFKQSIKEYMTKPEPKVAWYTRLVIGVALVAVLTVNSIGLINQVSESDRLIQQLTEDAAGVPNERNGGDGVVDHIFEAESAQFEGATTNNNSMSINYSKCPAYAFNFSSQFSGGVALRGLGSPKDETEEMEQITNTLTFHITSDKAVKVGMLCRVSAVATGNVYTKVQTNLNKYYALNVNGRNISYVAALPDTKNCDYYEDAGLYMGDVKLNIELKEGENIITFTFKEDAGTPVFDYINIQTSANLTATEYYDDWNLNECLTIVEEPNALKQGKIQLSNTNYTTTTNIPSVIDGLANGMYKQVDSDVKRSYYFAGMEVSSIDKTKQSTLTIVGDNNITFANGEKSITLYGGTDGLPETTIDTNIPEGKKFVGWGEGSSLSSMFTPENFTMDDTDMSIVPVFDYTEYATAVTKTLSKVNLNSPAEGNTVPIRQDDKGYGFTSSLLASGITNAVIFDGTNAEQGFQYNYTGGVKEGWSFLTMNPCQVSGKFTMYYALQNNGTETLEFDLYQTSASGNPKNASNPYEHVVLAPGEYKSIRKVWSTSNGNLMTFIEFTKSTSTNLALAMNQYVISGDVKIGFGAYHTVTITGGTFEGGEASIRLQREAGLPTITPDDNTKTVIGLTDGETFFSYEDFVMGDSDVTLSVVYAPDTVTANNGQLNFGVEQGANETQGTYIGAYQEKTDETTKKINSVKRGDWVKIGDRYGRKFTITAYGGIETTEPSGNNGSFRVLTYYSRGQKSYAISYTFKNFSDQTLSFQIFYRDYGTDPSVCTLSETITLLAGETKQVETVYTANNGGSNIITYFKFLTGCTRADLGIIADVSTTLKYQVTLAGGYTFSDGSTSKYITEGSEIPAIDCDKVLIGYLDSDGNYYSHETTNDLYHIVSGYTFTMPSKNLTLTPIFKPEENMTQYSKLDFGTSNKGEDGSNDVNCVIKYSATSVTRLRYTYFNDEVAREYKVTAMAGAVSSEGTGTNASFRTQTKYTVSKGTAYTFYFFVKNTGNQKIHFYVYMRAGGSDTSAVDYTEVELNAGESNMYTINWTPSGGNNNLLTYFKAIENMTDATFAVYCYEGEYQSQLVTLSGGVTFEDGTTTAKVLVNGKLPTTVLTDSENKTLCGWYVNDGETTTYVGVKDFVMSNKAVTLTPVITVTSGTGMVDWASGSIQTTWSDSLTAVSKASYVDGSLLGTKVTFTGTNAQTFRLMTAYKMDGKRKFTYTFKNLGTETISFTAYQVNSGNTITGVPTTNLITLNAGESTTVEMTATFSNQNVMCFFVLGSDATNAQLFVSTTISVVD